VSAAKKIVYLATDPLTAYRLMEGQLANMRSRGYDVHVITAPGELLERVAAREGVRVQAIPMSREISPIADLVSLVRLTLVLRRLRPNLVNAGTPKAGLLGVLAARAAGVPRVIYHVRGLRFEGAVGLRRLLLVASEHLAATLAHRVMCNSRSLRERVVSLRCAERERTFVPAGGSSNGVAVSLYESTPEKVGWAAQERRALGISDATIILGFVGRFTRDKGIAELVRAFEKLTNDGLDVALVLVGAYDDTDPIDSPSRKTSAFLRADSYESRVASIP
jgi:glycosyltransferase involved in cell wall biosynthesis